MIAVVMASLGLIGPAAAEEPVHDDPHQWLEDIDGEAALDWVRAKNAATVEALTEQAAFTDLKERLLGIYDSDERIPFLRLLAEGSEEYVNFWQSAAHPRGVWRKTTLSSYRTDEPAWQTVLDLDALAEEEGESWVWKGASCLWPDRTRCLLSLSRGGGDAVVIREFDLATRTFVEGGFVIDEAKTDAVWIDRDRLLVATDFGEGSLTESGYPRVVREWVRGTPLADAPVVFEGEAEDVAVGIAHDHTPGFERDVVIQATSFFTNRVFVRDRRKVDRPKELQLVDKPDSAKLSFFGEWALFELRDPWTVEGQTYPAGSLLAANLKRYLKGKRDLEVLFEPDAHTSLQDVTHTEHHLVLSLLEDVKSRFAVLTPGRKGWDEEPLPGSAEIGDAWVWPVSKTHGDDYWLMSSGFLQPSTLTRGSLATGQTEVLRRLPDMFDASGLAVSQHFATSDDGTKIPYFQVAPAELALDGTAPTYMAGYGGFAVSYKPSYRADLGAAWLERGGVAVIANIRGGGEYGPLWHQAAKREKRYRAYEDFRAVAADLVQRGVTTADRLAIEGGSNGGLLMGNMYTMYPEQFGAISCLVPLLDMKRYHLLLAGASWMGEYGDPDDPDDWAFMKGFSPYHNLSATTEDPPPMLIATSTRDDRVHPGHARKFKAAIDALGRDNVLYYENIEGGHGIAANNAQRAFMRALSYTFLWQAVTDE